MEATVPSAGKETVPFGVGVGVKQSCVVAPVIFSVSQAAASYLFREYFPPERGVGLTYRSTAAGSI